MSDGYKWVFSLTCEQEYISPLNGASALCRFSKASRLPRRLRSFQVELTARHSRRSIYSASSAIRRTDSYRPTPLPLCSVSSTMRSSLPCCCSANSHHRVYSKPGSEPGPADECNRRIWPKQVSRPVDVAQAVANQLQRPGLRGARSNNSDPCALVVQVA
jgi:hypothetical protein